MSRNGRWSGALPVGLQARSQRPDGRDILFGGAGTDIARNNLGDSGGETANQIHARDSDMILGDNGNVYRLVSVTDLNTGATSFLQFGYDQANLAYEDRGSLRIVVRAAQLLDYTPGGPDTDWTSLLGDNGAGDELHGESGDDFI